MRQLVGPGKTSQGVKLRRSRDLCSIPRAYVKVESENLPTEVLSDFCMWTMVHAHTLTPTQRGGHSDKQTDRQKQQDTKRDKERGREDSLQGWAQLGAHWEHSSLQGS